MSENELENEYKVFPSAGFVIGFQYKGQLATIKENTESKLFSAGITGMTDGYKIFKNSAHIGIRIKELNEKLFISQSSFEKRFRKVVGTTVKKFASIVRFNSVLNSLNNTKSLTEICYENNFFDQAHFINFPAYIQDNKKLGVTFYETYVINGHTDYYSANN